jgi:hypothetical protein
MHNYFTCKINECVLKDKDVVEVVVGIFVL